MCCIIFLSVVLVYCSEEREWIASKTIDVNHGNTNLNLSAELEEKSVRTF